MIALQCRITACVLVCLSCLVDASHAIPNYEIDPPTTPIDFFRTQDPSDDSWRIVISVGPAIDSNSVYLLVGPRTSNTNIVFNDIEITVVGSSTRVDLDVARGAGTVNSLVSGLQSVQHIGGAGELNLYARIQRTSVHTSDGNIGSQGEPGELLVSSIRGLLVDGGIYADIFSGTGAGSGRITAIAADGDFEGDIVAMGRIEQAGIQIGGNAGTATNPVLFQSPEQIARILVGGDLIGRIAFGEQYTMSDLQVGGDFIGELYGGVFGQDLTDGNMIILGDLDADIDLVYSSAAALHRHIDVGGDFLHGRTIAVGGSGMSGGALIRVGGILQGEILVQGDARGELDFESIGNQGNLLIDGFLDRRFTVHGAMDGNIEIRGNVQDHGNPTFPDRRGELDFKSDVGGSVIVLGTVDGEVGIDGDLSGGLYIGEDLLQPLTVGGELSGLLLIGRDLDAAGSITMDAPLSGQIIINEQNFTPSGIWGGLVTLPTTMPNAPNPITIGPGSLGHYESPHYIIASEFVGGGAIGLAPFSVHPTDTEGGNSCEINLLSITLWHYGPVYADGSDPPIKVFALDGSVEVEVTTDFAISFDDDPFTLDRRVTITLPPNTTFIDDYPGLRIEPVRAPESGYSVLRCAWVEGNPPVYDWSFSQVHDCDCKADLNGDGVVDADDFFLFLSLFADGDPIADINGDGVIDADDFFAYLTLFAAGC